MLLIFVLTKSSWSSLQHVPCLKTTLNISLHIISCSLIYHDDMIQDSEVTNKVHSCLSKVVSSR